MMEFASKQPLSTWITRTSRVMTLLYVFLLSLPVTVLADNPPVPARKTQALETVRKNLEQEKKRQLQLEGTLKNLKNELEDTRDKLVNIAAEVRKNEEDISILEKRIDKLSKEEIELTEKLELDYGSIASLILALERLQRTPTESLIVRPGAPLQTAQSAMLLQSTLPAVHKRTEQLSTDLKRLQNIEKALREDREVVLATKHELDTKYKEIRQLVAKRENLYGKTQNDYENNKRTVERLSREAKTLMDLIGKLEKEQLKRPVSYNGKLPDIGRVQLPITGYIIKAFGETDDIGATSQGVTIETRPRSIVLAPMGGIIRFAGYFKNYGNMVIIEHKNGYHSLLSGLEKIDAAIESRVKAGEPIGQLPISSSRGGSPALYYELRYNGQPVNPATKFSELRVGAH